jgi:hypothetical protein
MPYGHVPATRPFGVSIASACEKKLDQLGYEMCEFADIEPFEKTIDLNALFESLPVEPMKPLNAFEHFHREKKLDLHDVNPVAVYPLYQAKYDWEQIALDQKQKYIDMAVNDIVEYKEKYDHYTEAYNTMISLRDLVKWISSKEGSAVLRKLIEPPTRAKSGQDDPNGIKKARNAYMFYVSEITKTMPRETLKSIAQQWKQLSAEDKQKYKDMAKEDKQRYLTELVQVNHSYTPKFIK